MVPDANPRTRLLMTFFAGRHISPVGNSVAPQISIGTVAKEDARCGWCDSKPQPENQDKLQSIVCVCVDKPTKQPPLQW